MNIWLKTETIKQAKLRQSLAHSSAASLRSPLPIILQNQKIDDVLSNSNISIRLKSQESQSVPNSSDHTDQRYKKKYRDITVKEEMNQYHDELSIEQGGDNISESQFEFPLNKKGNNQFSYSHRREQYKKELGILKQKNSSCEKHYYEKNKHKSMHYLNAPPAANVTVDKQLYKQKPKIVRPMSVLSFTSSEVRPNSSQQTSKNKRSSSGSFYSKSKYTKNVYFQNQKEDFIERKNMTNSLSHKLKNEKGGQNFNKTSSNINNESRAYAFERNRSKKLVSGSLSNNLREGFQNNNDNRRQIAWKQQQYRQQQPQGLANKNEEIKKKQIRQQLQRKQQIYDLRMDVISTSSNALKNTQQSRVQKSDGISTYFLQNSRTSNKSKDSSSQNHQYLNHGQEYQQQISKQQRRKQDSRDNKQTRVDQPSISNIWKSAVGSFKNMHMQSSEGIASLTEASHISNSLSRSNFDKKLNISNTHSNSKRLLTTGRVHDRRQYIVSLIEYCSNQVGLACYNINTGQIKLTQIIERMTYLKTISTLQRFYPQQIIFSSTLEDTLLMRKLMNTFRRTSFKPVKRSLFDETKGYYIYSLRGNKSEHNPDHKFLSYAALHALLITMQSTFQFTLTYSALNIKWHFLEEVLVIDSQTVADLQIFINKQTKIIKNTFIDDFKCVTDGGTRLLRANVLQPLTDVQAITERYELVQLLLKNQNKIYYEMLIRQLSKFKNYESITAKFIQSPKCQYIKSVKSYLNAILLLSRMCFQLQNLQKKLGSMIENGGLSVLNSNGQTKSTSIIQKLYQKLTNERLNEIRKIIQENFDPQVLKNYELSNGITNNEGQAQKYKGSSRLQNQSQKPKRDSFIFLFKLQKIGDQFTQISRLTYSHTIEDILRHFQQIKQKCNIENPLKLLYNEHRGYYISGKSTESHPIDLSHLSNLLEDDIIFINKKGNIVTFTTSILISLNNRLKQNENKLIYQSMEILLRVIKDIQKYLQILFEVNYWLSMVDMVLGFAGFVKGYLNNHNVTFCKPQFVNKRSLNIQKLRTIWTMQKFHKLSTQINISINEPESALIIYKQMNSFDQLNILYSIGFLTILAQIGCLVPAQSFITSIYDTLISKMQVEGNLQNKLSHFQSQLVVLRNILENASHLPENGENKYGYNKQRKGKCLILIDEICKGSRPDEQYALSMAVVDQLIGNKKHKNIPIILVSDRALFNMLSEIEGSSLCQFSGPEEQENKNQDDALKIKQDLMLECFKTYNFNENFKKIYTNIPKLKQ